jgi:hypothetical protein
MIWGIAVIQVFLLCEYLAHSEAIHCTLNFLQSFLQLWFAGDFVTWFLFNGRTISVLPCSQTSLWAPWRVSQLYNVFCGNSRSLGRGIFPYPRGYRLLDHLLSSVRGHFFLEIGRVWNIL